MSTGGATSWQWDFGNGATSALQNPATTYFEPGSYTITLIASNDNGSDTLTRTAYITVHQLPRAEFTADKRNGCSPMTVQFTDNSVNEGTPRITGWKWDFGDGNTSTAQNPIHTYRAAGSYTVTLTVENDKGCSRLITKPNFITIVEGINADFAPSANAFCSAPAAVGFTNRTEGPGTLTYKWDFGDGGSATTTDANHTFQSDGTFQVSLVVSSTLGCTDTVTKPVVIGSLKPKFAAPENICIGIPVQFRDTSVPRANTVLWRFSTGETDTARNPVVSFPAAGNYTVTLIGTYDQCKDSTTKTVTISERPIVNFSAADTFKCQPSFTVNFQNATQGVSYVWNFGDGNTSTEANPSHTYTRYGTYSVQLTATNSAGCVDSVKRNNYIRIEKPVIAFPGFPKRGCLPYEASFRANITTLDEVTAYRWDFGDGGTSTEERPSHTYTVQGTYLVTLTITTRTGCTETFTLQDAVKVGTKPKADFEGSPLNTCASTAVTFTNLSPDPTDEYLWKFGDGGSSKDKNPAYEFSDTGYLDVTLIAYNSGCGDTLTKRRYVYIKPPISKFSYRPNCDNRLQFTFKDESIGAETWVWNFGDGSPEVRGQNPGPHTFPRRGSYRVMLTTTNGDCSFTATETVRIIDQTPDFTADAPEGCRPFNAVFTPSSPSGTRVQSYTWSFGDGHTQTAGVQKVGNTYTKNGAYDVTLTSTDAYGCQDTRTKKQYIRVYGPSAKFSGINTSGCVGLTVNFKDESATDGTHNLVKWQWDFGDSTSQTFTAPPFQHRYDTAGFFNVKLVVTDAFGCTDTVTNEAAAKISYIKAEWDVTAQSCPGAPVRFTNKTNNSSFTSLWSLGNGATSTQNSFSYTYQDTGYYTIKLKVKDAFGCEDSLSKPNAVYIGRPKADFTANNFSSFCTPFEAKFQNLSTYYSSSSWNFETSTSNQRNPTTYYTRTGDYDVKLVVRSPGGCRDSITKQVKVYNPNEGALKYAPVFGCRPLVTEFEAFTEMNARFIWDFGDGNVIDTTVNKFTHVYDNLGSYLPRIILQQPDGCVVPLTGKDTVEVIGAKIDFTLDKMLFCDSGTINVMDSTRTRDEVVSYIWNFGDGTTVNSVGSQVHHYKNPGQYGVSLTVTTRTGCKDSMTISPVKVVQSPLINILADSVICVNEFVDYTGLFVREDTSAVGWNWQFPNGNSSSVQNPARQQFTQAGNFMITTVATNSSGCTDTATKSLLVNPLPTITVPTMLTKTVGVPIVIPATYSSGIVSYNWTPNQSLSCADCPQPEATNKFKTLYNIAVVDSNGCKNTSQVQIVVLCPNVSVFVPNTFSPNSDGNNDVFYVRGKGLDRVKSLRIFNRWGEVVFEKRDFAVNDASAGWDGRFKGARPHPDVYVYQLEVFCENSEVIRFDGNVALIQ